MKSTGVLVVWLSVWLSAVAAAQGISAVRPVDLPASEALAHGQRGSPTLGDLVAEIDATGVMVHVVTGDAMLFGTRGVTRLVAVVGGWRYLRVMLSTHLSLDERAAMLAHELQHVLEIAQSAAMTQHAVRELYDAIGRPVTGGRDAFETAEAIDTGQRVWRELRSSGRATRRAARLVTQP